MIELRERFRKRHNTFNKLLSRYAYVPALAYGAETEFWYFQAVPKPEIKIKNGTGLSRQARSLSFQPWHVWPPNVN